MHGCGEVNRALCHDLRQTQDRNAALLLDLHAVKKDLDGLKQKQFLMYEDVSSHDTNLKTLLADNAKLQTDVTSLQADNAKLQTDVTSLQADNAKLQTDVTSLQADNAVWRSSPVVKLEVEGTLESPCLRWD